MALKVTFTTSIHTTFSTMDIKMTAEQHEQLQTILNETWMHTHSLAVAFDMIEDLIYEIRQSAMREVELLTRAAVF